VTGGRISGKKAVLSSNIDIPQKKVQAHRGRGRKKSETNPFFGERFLSIWPKRVRRAGGEKKKRQNFNVISPEGNSHSGSDARDAGGREKKGKNQSSTEEG